MLDSIKNDGEEASKEYTELLDSSYNKTADQTNNAIEFLNEYCDKIEALRFGLQ